MNRRPHFSVALLLGISMILVVGCDGEEADDKGIKGAKLTGQLLENGQPLKLVSPEEDIQVSFVNVADENIASPAEFNTADSTFTVNGPTGHGLPAGTYKIGIASEIYGGDGTNRFETAFDSQTTPLKAEVGGEEGQHFLIDLKKKTVTKQ